MVNWDDIHTIPISSPPKERVKTKTRIAVLIENLLLKRGSGVCVCVLENNCMLKD